MKRSVAARNVRRTRDWSALPEQALQLILRKASSWQIPGACLAAPVCRGWRSAALRCRGVRLLYHAGRFVADQSFATWLRSNSAVLGALTLYISPDPDIRNRSDIADGALAPLADAAAASAAAGHPLPLHTLRVLGPGPSLAVTGQLLAGLPRLQCLQLALDDPGNCCPSAPIEMKSNHEAVLEGLGPLQQGPRLQQLHLKGPGTRHDCSAIVAGLLPHTLERLIWQPAGTSGSVVPDLSHLEQVTFLALSRWRGGRNLTSNQLPPGLQELQLRSMPVPSEVLLEQQQVLTAWHADKDVIVSMQQQVGSLQRVEAATGWIKHVAQPEVCAALGQLPLLSTLSATAGKGHGINLGGALLTSSRMPNVRRLDLHLRGLPMPTRLPALTALTRLRVTVPASVLDHMVDAERRRAWTRALGSMAALQWLSVPAALLEPESPSATPPAPPHASLGGLQHLKVLALSGVLGKTAKGVASWLDDSTLNMLPPQLQLLGWGGVSAEQAKSWQLRRRLRQLLGNSGCEVVVGVDLDEVPDPALQVAGVPEALQQLLLG